MGTVAACDVASPVDHRWKFLRFLDHPGRAEIGKGMLPCWPVSVSHLLALRKSDTI